MIKNKHTAPPGFTITELAITTIIMIIPILVIGIILADSHRGWNTMYNRIYSDVATDSYVSVKTFDALVRRASKDGVILDDDGDWVEVHYYQDSYSVVVDRYALFFVDGSDLIIEYGQLNPKTALNTQTVCENVSGARIKGRGRLP